MSPILLATLMSTFVAVALLSGAIAYTVLERQAPGRRRLQQEGAGKRVVAAVGSNVLTDRPSRTVERIASFVPKSPGEMGKLRRRMVRAGYHSLTAAVVFSMAELIAPIVLGLPPVFLMPWPLGLILGGLCAMVGFLLPSVVLARLIERRRVAITNGLPDVLDLLIVCLEAGCSLDQAIVKATEELALAYPALGEELRMLTTETRAGKPRMEAFKNLEARTKNDDVRSLVAMLGTDRPVRDERVAGAADLRRGDANQTPPARRGTCSEGRREDGLPAGAVPLPGALRRHTRRGCHSDRQCLLWSGRRSLIRCTRHMRTSARRNAWTRC